MYARTANAVLMLIVLFLAPQGFCDTDSISATAAEGPVDRPSLEISGFVDCFANYHKTAPQRTRFSIGQAEVDLFQQVSPRIGAALAIAYSSDNSTFSLGAAELSYLILDKQDGLVQSLALVAGQFDVPFGLEYQHYASINRETVTAPWLYAAPGEWCGWNDLGVRLEGELAHGSIVAYAVNGFADCTEITHRVFNLATSTWEDSVESLELVPDISLGERIGFTPNDVLAFGSSVAIALSESGAADMVLAGGDLQLNWNPLSFRGEFIRHWKHRTVAEARTDGYYGLLTYHLNHARLHTRYAATISADDPHRHEWTAGCAYQLYESTEVRFEWVFAGGNDESQAFLQLVVGF